jgi:membrane associated rhomboid family serine protease
LVIPLFDHDPSDFKVPPYVTWVLIVINVVVFLVQQATGGGEFLMVSYGAIPAVIAGDAVNPSPLPAWATLFTSMFLHAGWLHVGGNMLYLFVFGDDIEEALGWWRFLLFYLASGVGAALAYVAVNQESVGPMIGASGAIAGVLAAYLMLRPCAKLWVLVFVRPVRIAAMWAIGLWIALQFYDIASGDDDGVAYGAHIGGLVAGALLFCLLRPREVVLFECITEPEKPADE